MKKLLALFLLSFSAHAVTYYDIEPPCATLNPAYADQYGCTRLNSVGCCARWSKRPTVSVVVRSGTGSSCFRAQAEVQSEAQAYSRCPDNYRRDDCDVVREYHRLTHSCPKHTNPNPGLSNIGAFWTVTSECECIR